VEATAPGVCTVQFMQSNRLTDIKERLSLSEPSALRSQRPDCRLHQKLRQVIDSLVRCEVVARAGIAQNADASFLAAHRAEPVLAIKEAKEFLAPLPIETLAVEATF
jgi:hypothetical protein